jgi:hypothetical protein
VRRSVAAAAHRGPGGQLLRRTARLLQRRVLVDRLEILLDGRIGQRCIA